MSAEKLVVKLFNRKQAWAAIKAQVFPFLKAIFERGGYWELIIQRCQRTDAQNRRYWGRGVLKQIAEQAVVNGRQFDPEVWHEQFKRQFIGVIELPSGQLQGQSSARLTTVEFSEFCTEVEAFAATHLGVTFYDLPEQDWGNTENPQKTKRKYAGTANDCEVQQAA